MSKAALVTGSAGSIGSAIVQNLKGRGYLTIGIDKDSDQFSDISLTLDLEDVLGDEQKECDLLSLIEDALRGNQLKGLVNNAAVQIVTPAAQASTRTFQRILNVNLVAPFLLSRLLFDRLAESSGAIVNLSSIHQHLTKPGFVTYAASKGGLATLTRSMAVEYGGKVRVNSISPAAIETEMLAAGFADNPDGLQTLKAYHPSGAIGIPADVAKIVAFLIDEQIEFLTGADIALDGGIGSRLHDPV